MASFPRAFKNHDLDVVNKYKTRIEESAKRGDTEDVEKTLQEMLAGGLQTNQAVIVHNWLLHAYAMATDFDSAEKCFQKMVEHGLEPNLISFNSMIDAYAKAGNVGGAEAWLKRLIET